VSKNFPDGKRYRSAKELGNIAKKLELQLGEELAKRRVPHPNDVSLAKYPSERVRVEKEEAAAKGKPTKLTRALDKQWNKHGLTLRELLDLYNRHGSQAPAPARDDLVKKCKQYGLSTSGDLWDVEKAIFMYELTSRQRMYGLPPRTINEIISDLSGIEAPVESVKDDGDDGGKDGDSKGKDTSKGGKKDTSASPKGSKKGGSKSPKGDKTDGADKDGSKDGKKDGKDGDKKDGKDGGKKDGKDDSKKGGRKNDKDTGAAKIGTKRATRSSKTKDLGVEDHKLIGQKEITVTEDGQAQRFTQQNVSGVGNRCIWNAIQLLWTGKQKAKGKLAVAYPVNDRVRDLWNAVMHPTGGTTNAARQARHALYTQMQQNSQTDLGSLEARINDRQWGMHQTYVPHFNMY
jgi:hypothetical protein